MNWSQLCLTTMAGAFLSLRAIAAPSEKASPAQGVTLSKEGMKIEEDGHSVEFGDNGTTKINSHNPDFDRGIRRERSQG